MLNLDSSVCNPSGKLHLHRISQTHQLRPTLTYIDVLTRKVRRRTGANSDSDSDDGPPPDPDEPPPSAPKKQKKVSTDVKEVQVAIQKIGDDKTMQLGGGLTAMRREMLSQIRAEEDERWEDLQYYDAAVRGFQSILQLSYETTSRLRSLMKRSSLSSRRVTRY